MVHMDYRHGFLINYFQTVGVAKLFHLMKMFINYLNWFRWLLHVALNLQLAGMLSSIILISINMMQEGIQCITTPMQPRSSLNTGTYTEQVVWRNMLTGHALAQSKFTEAMIVGALITPGFGGRVYYLTNDGFIVYYVTNLHSTNSTTTDPQGLLR